VSIEDITDAIRSNRIRITDHADEGAQADHLSFDEIFFSVFQGKSLRNILRICPILVASFMAPLSGAILSIAFGRTIRTTSGLFSSRSIALILDDGFIGASGDHAMIPFHTCPVCGGEMVEKEVEKLLRGGMHTAVLTVRYAQKFVFAVGNDSMPQKPSNALSRFGPNWNDRRSQSFNR
jgi:hypothetical protein